MKIANIIGARPQFIKYFPVAEAIKNHNKNSGNAFYDILIHTGQHYDYKMSKIFFDEFGIKQPDFHLGVGSETHGKQTGQIIQKVEDVLIKEKPDIVVVYGDTNSTLGGALASSKLHTPIAHIEAGLRSYNKRMPEEINRVLTDHVSTFLFCPSKTSAENLVSEGFKNVLNGGALIPENHSSTHQTFTLNGDGRVIINVGDVMYDVLLHSIDIAERRSRILEKLMLAPRDYCLFTLHRAENTDRAERLAEIVAFVNDVSNGKTVVFPMHPRAKKACDSCGIKLGDNIRVIEPIGYFDMLLLLKNSSLLLTDSGGMQKESYWLKVPCITLRDETEWTETVESGWNILYKNYRGVHRPSDVNSAYYGDGKAAGRIISVLGRYK